LVAGALIHVAEPPQTRREVVERDHTKNVGKRPLDESGKDPVNEDHEKILRAAVPLRDSGRRHCERSEAICAERFWIASAFAPRASADKSALRPSQRRNAKR
jgi:hypothetical protein